MAELAEVFGVTVDDELLAEQIAYYRERAPEFDRWWYRTHQYELPPDRKAAWDADVAATEEWLRSLRPLGGRVLELACGTGLWTRHLVEQSDHVVAVDASPEMIEHNAARMAGRDDVSYVEADVFALPDDVVVGRGPYDTVFFSFWLSHVPPDRMASFWSTVERALVPGGRAVFIDNRWGDDSWRGRSRPTAPIESRTDLSSGRAYNIVKVYYEADDLMALLDGLGWDAEVSATGPSLLVGWARPRRRT